MMELTLFGAALVILCFWAYVRSQLRGIKKMREEFEESARNDEEFQKVWEELNDLKSRMAKPGDVSRLIEQYERDLAKGEVFVPKTHPMPTPVPECWKPHKAHDIVRELKRQEMDDLCKRIMDVPAAWSRVQDSPSFGGGDFGGSGAGDSYGSSDGGGSSSND